MKISREIETRHTRDTGKKNKKKNRSGSIDQQPQQPPTPSAATSAAVASFEAEDLSLQRHDEETVLAAIYGDDFTLESGAWNCPMYKLRIRPASDVTDHNDTVLGTTDGGEQQIIMVSRWIKPKLGYL